MLKPVLIIQSCALLSLSLSIGQTAFGQAMAQVATVPGATVTTTSAPNTTTTTAQQPPNGVEIEIGIGSRIGGPGISNYQSGNGALSLTNLGRATPQLLTGLGFSCDTSTTTAVTATAGVSKRTVAKNGNADDNNFCNSRYFRHMGVFISAQFGTGSSQTISGYSVGMTYALYKNLRLLAGLFFHSGKRSFAGLRKRRGTIRD